MAEEKPSISNSNNLNPTEQPSSNAVMNSKKLSHTKKGEHHMEHYWPLG